MIEQKLRKFDIHCEESLRNYIQLINTDEPIADDEYTEKHHILPRSMYPEYVNDAWNIKVLTYNNHILAHEYLAKMFNNLSMWRAFNFMLRYNAEDKHKFAEQLSNIYSGDNNPAKLPGVGEKISKAKSGKSRPDMYNKRYFGADEKTIKNGLDAMSKKLKGTVVVKDKDNNMYRVSVNDERYLNGELVPNATGLKFDNHHMKNEKYTKNLVNKRNERYNKIRNFSFNEICDFLVENHNNGKVIFGKKRPFSKNFSMFVNLTKYNQNDVKNAVVQRLEKDLEKQ